MSPVILAQTIGSAALVVSLMFSVGLELEPRQFRALLARRRVVAATLLVNLAAIPGLAWALGAALELPAEVVIGVMLCAAAPGGPVSALFTATAGADLVLTASMTILLPTLGVIATPLILSATVDLPAGAEVPVAPMIGTLVVFQVIPLVTAMIIRRRRLELAERLLPYARGTANAVLLALVIGLSIVEGKVLLSIDAPTYLTLLAVLLASLILGYLAARPERDMARAGALVAGCRNISAAIMLAATFFPGPVVNATILAYGLMSFVIPIILARVWRSSGGLTS